MRPSRRGAAAACLITIAALGSAVARAGEPANGLTLSGLARELAATPGAFDAILAKVTGAAGAGAGSLPLGDEQINALKAVVAASDYAALDREPRLTLAQLGALVEVAARRASQQEAAAPAAASPAVEDLGIPTGGPLPDDTPKDLGFGVTSGGHMDRDLRERYPDSKRLAQVLERLSGNRPGTAPAFTVRYAGESITTPEALMKALRRTGHKVEVTDRRRAANFADLEKDGRPVAAPLWLRTGRRLANGDEVVVPAPHSELVISVSGPTVKAFATFFNGIDTSGKGGSGVHFRPWGSRGSEWWVGGKTVNRYRGDEAVEAVRIMGDFHRAAWDKVRANALPLGGYFKLGVCSTAPAVVEKALRGRTTAWPLVQDPSLFGGDGEIDRLVRSLPTDGRGEPTPDERVLAASPWRDPKKSPFPEVRDRLGRLAAESTQGLAPALSAGGK